MFCLQLDMFRRPDDPPSYSKLLMVPVLGLMAFYIPRAAAGVAAGALHETVALASSLCWCVHLYLCVCGQLIN